MKIYTKTGDHGETGLFGGARVSKASGRVDAYGNLDELNAWLGVCRTHSLPADIDAVLAAVQVDLFALGAELATVPGKEDALGIARVGDAEVARLEAAIDASEGELAPLRSFILPGDHPARRRCTWPARCAAGPSARWSRCSTKSPCAPAPRCTSTD